MRIFLASGLGLLVVLSAMPVQANPDVISREYKLILDASRFQYRNEQSDVLNLMQAAKPAIEEAIDRNVIGTATLPSRVLR